jgi:hypothetical protein
MLQQVRVAELNLGVDAFSLAQLLWRDEVIVELRRRGVRGQWLKKARHYLWEDLVTRVELAELW